MKYSFLVISNLFLFAILCNRLHGQQKLHPVYVDSKGVLRWTADRSEAAFFGVNYTVPFAYSYRAHEAIGVSPEEAIRQDVYHFARLGFNAFRVHVWDTEISDSAGNLLENEHLRLFDFLLWELKKRNIYTIITPIAFWGNGYPERDEPTPGFARKYGKSGSTTNDTAIRAQENYLRQFFQHVNPYTKQRYGDDWNVIATEINNEPSHSGARESVTEYINRLTTAIRATGWIKPVYYNISQNPSYADAVARAAIDGVSFQWYPSGLVSNNTLRGNYLPHVSRYTIPFDTIPQYRNKTRMVYEFDAADILSSCMYPAMARSFRGAGFQWATQFAYDPLAIASANTEYQTHYLNLAYTPGKAISMMIAGEVFRNHPRGQIAETAMDTIFSQCTVSYSTGMSLLNAPDRYYHSTPTEKNPVNISSLKHIAGVGHSPLVKYSGTGAYFIDQVADGVWRLEVMPDALVVDDPFGRASPAKEVVRLEWRSHQMKIALPQLGNDFTISGLNEENEVRANASSDSFMISPGTYLLARRNTVIPGESSWKAAIGLREFVAPRSKFNGIQLRHEPAFEAPGGRPHPIRAVIAGAENAKVSIQATRVGGGQSRFIPMEEDIAGTFMAELPAELFVPGQVQYRIIIQKGEQYRVFPGNIDGHPFAWDSYRQEWYKTHIAPPEADISLYVPYPTGATHIHPAWRRGFHHSYTASEHSGRLALRLDPLDYPTGEPFGVQHYIGDRIESMREELPAFDKVVLRLKRTGEGNLTGKIILLERSGISFSAPIQPGNGYGEIKIPLTAFSRDSCLLLPRPYPGFLPLWYYGNGEGNSLNLQEVERVQLVFEKEDVAGPVIEISYVGLGRRIED